jgi:hypothetical protein
VEQRYLKAQAKLITIRKRLIQRSLAKRVEKTETKMRVKLVANDKGRKK